MSGYLVYTGSYTTGASKGVYCYRLDTASAALTPLGLAAELANPSFLAIHPSRRYLYAVHEAREFDGKPGGAVSALAIDAANGRLTLLNRQSSGGAGPCHVNIDRTGANALVANYGAGSLAVLPVEKDGSLKPATAVIQHKGSSVNPKRQQGPHAHSVNLSPDNRFAIVADLGLDQVFVYRFHPADHMLVPNAPPSVAARPGAGPRHFAFHPNGRWAYVINELDSTVVALAWDADKGVLKPLQTISTLPDGFKGDSTTAEVQVHPSGKWVYGSNRGADTIRVFAVDASGKLSVVADTPTGGKTPRNFGIDPSGKVLIAANQASDNLAPFRIDAATGRLTPTGQTVDTGNPVCVKFV